MFFFAILSKIGKADLIICGGNDQAWLQCDVPQEFGGLVCGDGICTSPEVCGTCATDCGVCPVTPGGGDTGGGGGGGISGGADVNFTVTPNEFRFKTSPGKNVSCHFDFEGCRFNIENNMKENITVSIIPVNSGDNSYKWVRFQNITKNIGLIEMRRISPNGDYETVKNDIFFGVEVPKETLFGDYKFNISVYNGNKKENIILYIEVLQNLPIDEIIKQELFENIKNIYDLEIDSPKGPIQIGIWIFWCLIIILVIVIIIILYRIFGK